MPLDLRPLPILAVDPPSLYLLIPSDTLFVRFLPWIHMRRLFDFKPLDSFPPYDFWDITLETHWQKVHPAAWDILEEDDKKDWDELYRIEDGLYDAKREQAISREDEVVAMALFRELAERISMRGSRILALHLTRKAAFATGQARNPKLTLRDFIQTLPTGDLNRCATCPTASQ
ncbi:hypothetical protein JCM11251_002696 [Rhodosporidiobolus azoricus]